MEISRLALIGGGNMATSLIGGLLKNNYPPEKIWVSGPNETKLKKLQQQLPVNITIDNLEAVKNADVVIFCVKPQILFSVCQTLALEIQKKKPLIISIASGIPIKSLEKWLQADLAIIRAMPNTPALIGCGASALYANPLTTLAQKNYTESIMRSLGMIVWVEKESWMDTVTALSGCGPAYFFLICEVLQQAATEMGLPENISKLLTLQTAYGSSRMALESDISLNELRQKVTSKGGSTEQAIKVLENKEIRQIFKDALLAASNRSKELAETFGSTR